MKSLIIGAGEVGTSLKNVLKPYHEIIIRDKAPMECKDVEVLHICYPDFDGFVETTKNYISEYKPHLTVIHSSVRIGTTRKCGNGVVYSPIRGRHPDNGLDKEMKSFVKFIACVDPYYSDRAFDYFSVRANWTCFITRKPESLEFLKMLSNIHMGLEIAWRQEVERMEKKLGIEEGVYGIWEETYRKGYQALNQPNLIRPVMRPDPIGGHCILPCTELLKQQFESKFFDLILESNKNKLDNK